MLSEVDETGTPSWARGDDIGSESNVTQTSEKDKEVPSSWRRYGGVDGGAENDDDEGEGEDLPLAAGTDDDNNSLDSWKQHKNASPGTNARRSCPHRAFRCVKFLAMVAATLMFVIQIISVIFFPVNHIQIVLKLYVASFCVLVMFNELEWSAFVRESRLLSVWVSRGYMYTFAGIVGAEENHVTGLDDVATISEIGYLPALIFIKVASWMLVAIGVIYFLMGIFCCQSVYKNEREKYDRKGGN